MFNSYSLKALVMRYALYNERFGLAARLAREIVDCGIWELHPNYGDLFQYQACSKNKEFIIHLNRESNNNAASNSFQYLGPHYRTGNGHITTCPVRCQFCSVMQGLCSITCLRASHQ
jgi:hypothetical protein